MKPEVFDDYVAMDFSDIPTFDPVDRREFFKRLGGGILILISLDSLAQEEGGRFRGRPSLPSDFNAFVKIGEDGRVTCYTGKIEMGQGPITSLPQMLAEELEVPVDSVDIVMGDTALCPADMGTFGSMTTRNFGPALRAAAAEARGVLLELGADTLKLPASQLVARDGVVLDSKDEKNRVTYAELAKGQKIARHLQEKPGLKKPSQFKVMGKSLLRRDAHDKVTGKAQYAGDIRLPGMLYAKLLRPPAHGAKLKSVNTDACKEVPGAQVVHEDDLVAVLHPFPDVAETALAKIKAEFEPSPSTLDDENIFEHLLKVAPEPNIRGEGGDLEAGKKAADKKFETTYLNSYVAHSAMETHTALAKVEDGQATVWASTQNPFGAQRELAQVLQMPTDKIRVITPFVGGGFGGKTQNSQAVEAARLAKIVGKPVQVCRTREEEFFYDTFRPAAIVKINSGVDASGKITFWDYSVYFAGDRGAPHFYSIPNHRTASFGGGWGGRAETHPFATGAWRAPGNNTNTFARESQIELMAAGAGIDPVEFRIKNLTDRKMLRVLKAAADQFGWTPAKGPSKRGFGVACGVDAGTSVAGIAEVAVDSKKGTVQVKRVVVAQDMGVVVNPEGAKIQMEGCITMGMGYALAEEVHFKAGQVLDTNYDTYELPKFSWVPKIETVILDSTGAPQGGGEPAIILMGALLANAVYDATGARLLQLPMTPDRVKEALAKA
jgi:isoquinoline 1-oxidoreductase